MTVLKPGRKNSMCCLYMASAGYLHMCDFIDLHDKDKHMDFMQRYM